MIAGAPAPEGTSLGDLEVAAGVTKFLPAPIGGVYTANSITVLPGATLIAVGKTRFEMADNARIEIEGRFQAIGAGEALADRVQFVSAQVTPNYGAWDEIEAYTGADVEIRYALIADTQSGYFSREADVSSRISHSWFRNSAASCASRCETWNEFGCIGKAISIWNGYAEVTDNVIYSTKNIVTDKYSAGTLNIQGTAAGTFIRRNAIHRSATGILTVGTGIEFTDNITIDSQIGIEIRGPATLSSNRFYGEKYGIRLANWETQGDLNPLVEHQVTVAAGAVVTTSILSVANANEFILGPGSELHFYSGPVGPPGGQLLIGNIEEATFASSCNKSRYESGGKLTVRGLNADPVIFDVSPEAIPVSEPAPDGLSAPTYTIAINVPAADGANRWEGILISEFGSGSLIDHASILNAKSPVTVIGNLSDPSLTTATVSNSLFDDFGTNSASNPDISAAVFFQYASGQIESNTIRMTDGTAGGKRSGILLEASMLSVTGNDIQFKAHSGIRVINETNQDASTDSRISNNVIDTQWDSIDDPIFEFGVGIAIEGARVDSIDGNLIRNNRIGLFLESKTGTNNKMPFAAGIHDNVFIGHEAADRWAIYSEIKPTGLNAVYASENYWGSEDLSIIGKDLIWDHGGDPYYDGGTSSCTNCGVVRFVNFCEDSDLNGPLLLMDGTPNDALRVEEEAACAGGIYWVGGRRNSDFTIVNRGSDANTLITDLIMESPGVLTIEAGAVIEFVPGTEILIEGTIVVEGDVDAPVIFKSALPSPQPGDWEGIRITGGTNSVIRNAEIYVALIGIRITGSDTLVVDTIISNFGRITGAPTEAGAGISLEDFEGDIRDTTITGRGESDLGDATGIRIDGGNPLILGNVISATGSGIEIINSTAQLVANTITATRNDGVVVDVTDGSNPTIGPANKITASGGRGVSIDLNGSGDFGAAIHFNTVSGSTSFNLSITEVSTLPGTADALWNDWGLADPSTQLEADTDLTINYERFVKLDGTLSSPGALPTDPNPALPLNHYLSGELPTQTLSDTSEKYYALGDIVVTAGNTLTIGPGVTILFPEHAKLRVDGGVLKINGTLISPVILDSEDGSVSWAGIEIRGSADSEIKYATISNAFRAIDVGGGSTVDILNSTISNYGGSLLKRTPGAGIRFVDSMGIATGSRGIVGNTIESPKGGGEANYAIYVEATECNLIGKDDLEIYGNQLSDADIGIMLVGAASPQIGLEDLADYPSVAPNVITGTVGDVGIVLAGSGDAACDPNPIIKGNDLKGNDLLTTVGIEIRDYYDGSVAGQSIDLSENWWGTDIESIIETRISYLVDEVEEFGAEPAVEIDFSHFLDESLDNLGSATATVAAVEGDAITNLVIVTPVIKPSLGTDLVVEFRLRETANITLEIWPDGMDDDKYCSGGPRDAFFYDVPGSGSPVAIVTIPGLGANADGSGSPHQITWAGVETGGQDAVPGPYAFVLYAERPSDSVIIGTHNPPRVKRSHSNEGEVTTEFNVYENMPYVAKLTARGAPQLLVVWLKLNPSTKMLCNLNQELYNAFLLPEDEETFIIWDGRHPDSPYAPIEGLVGVELGLLWETGLMRNGFILADAAPVLTDLSGEAIPFVRSNPFAVAPIFEQDSVLNFVSDQDATVTVKLLPPGVNLGDPEEIDLTPTPLSVTKEIPEIISLNLEVSARELHTAATGYFTYVIEATSTADTSQKTTQRGMVRIHE